MKEVLNVTLLRQSCIPHIHTQKVHIYTTFLIFVVHYSPIYM